MILLLVFLSFGIGKQMCARWGNNKVTMMNHYENSPPPRARIYAYVCIQHAGTSLTRQMRVCGVQERCISAGPTLLPAPTTTALC